MLAVFEQDRLSFYSGMDKQEQVKHLPWKEGEWRITKCRGSRTPWLGSFPGPCSTYSSSSPSHRFDNYTDQYRLLYVCIIDSQFLTNFLSLYGCFLIMYMVSD